MRYTEADAREAFFDASSVDDAPPWAIERWDEPPTLDLASILLAPRDDHGEHPVTLF